MTTPATEHATIRNRILFALGLLIGALLLWLAIRGADTQQIAYALRTQTNFWYAIPFIVALLLFFWLKALRWGYLLTMAEPGTLNDRFASVLIGYTGNLILPAQMGELVRTYILAKRLRTPVMPIFTSIALERIFDLIAMLVFLLGAILYSGQSFPWMRTLGFTLAVLILAGLAACYIYVVHTRLVLRMTATATGFLPAGLRQRLLDLLEQGATGIGSLRRPALLLKILVSSCLMWFAMAICAWLALIAVDIQLPFTVAVFILTVVIGGMMLPASPGFIGTIQFCFVLVLNHYGIAKEQAIVASLFYHLLISVPILLMGYTLVLKMGYSAAQLRREADKINSVKG